MQANIEITESDCCVIATKIRKDIFEQTRTSKTSVFLCGKSISDKTSIRYKLANVLGSRSFYSSNYDLLYPEDLFEELLSGSASFDLLSLENLLADSVDVVVIILESVGSFAELGAFVSNEKLRSKIVCVVEEKYKRDKSFINQGPLKLIKRLNKSAVVYIDESKIGKHDSRIHSFIDLLRDAEAEKIVSSIRRIRKANERVENKITLLQLDKILLPAIFLLEPVNKLVLTQIVASATDDKKNSLSSTATALTMLTKKRFIESTSEGFRLTTIGNNEFIGYKKNSGRVKSQKKTIAIDNLRLEILNLKYRNKKMKV